MKAKNLFALLLALAMVLSLAACGSGAPSASAQDAAASAASAGGDAAVGEDPYKDPYADPYKNQGNDPYNDPYKNQGNDPYADPYKTGDTQQAAAQPETPVEEYMPESGENYTVTKTADGWIQIENKDGATLGLSPTSGVKLVEDAGLAFKDLNQNGKLDVYEDWRASAEDRANDLVNQMQGAEMAAILAHGGWGDFTTDPLTAEDGSATYLRAGGRGGVTRNIGRGGGVHAKWANAIQAVAESCYYGIPAMISIDPSGISGLTETVALGSTMDPELAAKVGQETAKEYRAAGVTALLGPQVDIASPVMSRAGGTYGEDPQLTLDIATAYVNGMQSTYDGDKDLGWGPDSVYCFTKHFGGAGATEGGRDDHANSGRYAVFPGDNLEAHLITYFDGVFNLPGKTGSSGIMTEYAINVDGEGTPYGGEWAGVYNPFIYGMLNEAGFDSLKITDWGVYEFAGVWGAEDMELPDRIALSWEQGANLLGGFGDMNAVAAAYDKLVERNGEDKALEIIKKAAYNYVVLMMNLGMFDEPYSDSAKADKLISVDGPSDLGLESQRDSVVMIKNDGTISGDAKDKPKVYIPYVWSNEGTSVTWMFGIGHSNGTWEPGMDLDVMGKYFDVVTDTLAEPSGEPDDQGNPTYKPEDLTRASKDEIAACDYVLVGMTGAYTASYNKNTTGAFGGAPAPEGEDEWYPVSLQYAPYTAATARETSISGKVIDGVKENRSYKDKTAEKDVNYGHLEALQYAADAAGDIPVIVSMKMERGMVWDEVEPLADVILVCYNAQRPDVVGEIVTGKTEPKGLLVFQQPKDMEEVEKQLEDVPRDMECYKDSDGNVYDFAFGLNWSGKIDDDRVKTYTKDPLTSVKSFDFKAYMEANK